MHAMPEASDPSPSDDRRAARRVVALLLAAGTSSRMGDFKQLMPYRGRTFVEACAETLLASSVDETLVVLGHRAEEVRRTIASLPVRVVVNEAYLDGMATSIKAGVRAIAPGSADAILVALCDQPHVPVPVVDAVVAAYRSSSALIVAPAIAGDSGHPVIFDLSLRDEILAIDPAHGLRAVTYAHRENRLRVPVDTVAVIDDVDTPDDYQRIVVSSQ
jgi:molybdenum cofactor cytidylyltransferase